MAVSGHRRTSTGLWAPIGNAAEEELRGRVGQWELLEGCKHKAMESFCSPILPSSPGRTEAKLGIDRAKLRYLFSKLKNQKSTKLPNKQTITKMQEVYFHIAVPWKHSSHSDIWWVYSSQGQTTLFHKTPAQNSFLKEKSRWEGVFYKQG